ncbi:MAG: DNA-formamidopyrimidine glycosylase family protein, partial [Chloroflexota bacterium]|nr:DNA-formamidopyrimidine glycosylase family protein [Chloroflexota bacterium]
MPELPEVETITRGLRGPLIGRRFTGVRVGWRKIVATPTVEEFQRRLVGQGILDVKRRGKYIICELSGRDVLIFHLRMTGCLWVVPSDRPLDKYDYAIFSL